MKFEIKNRFTGSVQFTAEIECGDDAGYSVKLGLAVRATVKSRADLSGAYLSGAYLSRANLSDADLSRADLSGADLSGAYLSRADLSGADLSDADLSRADLSGAYLSGADLSGAYLSGAYLSRAYLSGADLSRANLSGAYLSRADLSGADLSGADLSGANLSGAKGVAGELSTSLMMLLDQPGAIRAYKLVNEDDEGHINGGLKYIVGETVSVGDACTDPTKQCAAGINVATLDWCLREWRSGYRVLIVEFTAADIAAIPLASDGKFRLHRCKVIAEKALDYAALGLVKAEEQNRAAQAA